MKLQTKLMLAPAATGALLVVVVAASLWLLNAFKADSRRSHDAVLAADARVADARTQLGALHTQLYRTLTIIGSMDDAAVKATREQQARALDAIAAGIAAKAAAAQNDEDLKRALGGFAGQAVKYRTAADNAIDLATVDPNTGVAALQTADAAFKALGQTLADMTAHVQARTQAEAAALDASARRGAFAIGAIGALAVVLSMAFAWIVQRRIAAGIIGAAQTAAEVAAGRLDRRPHSDASDEVGALVRALGTMVEQLRQSIGAVQRAAESIGTSSSEIASGSADLSQRTEEAASSLQQTASSMEQLTGTVKQSAESASTADQLASSAAQAAQRGGAIVGEVVATMNEINASSKRIADIIGVIDGIAFQTNILALNAAVEAARAGEQGRGFAVVAGEVRALAQRSAEAAKEIKALIGTSVGKVEAGSRLVTDAGATMHEIVASVQRVSDVIGEITAASAEQSSGIGQVNVAVTQLDQMTQRNAALVEQSAAAAESLQQQARTLASVVSAFRLSGTAA